jgi:Na+/proline symporter
VPFFYRSGVYTAYEILERRFDAKTRSATSLLFLISRGLAVGAVVSAPAVVLSLVLGWNLTATSLAITIPAVIYTMFGGVQAVTWTDVKTMALIVFGLFALIGTAWLGLPADVGIGDGLAVAAAGGRLRSLDFSLNLTEQYTFWSGMIASVFLFCSYFGTDQSQVQRYLTARSVDEARHSLLMSAYWKIPLQAVVLAVGVLVFVFYHFNPGPLIFSSAADAQMRSGPAAEDYRALQSEYETAFDSRRTAAVELARARRTDDGARRREATAALQAREAELEGIRVKATELVRQTNGDRTSSDVNYIIPTFVLTELPIGLVGVLIVAILMAATDTIAGELNSLATATIIDFYKRWIRPTGPDAHYLAASKIATGLWGLFACMVAVWAAELGSLIEVVNRFGSFFYGSILGVFVLAIAFPRATANGAFVGLVAGMASVAWAATYTNVAFLWHNVIGVAAVIIVGLAVSRFDPAVRSRTDQRTPSPATF